MKKITKTLALMPEAPQTWTTEDYMQANGCTYAVARSRVWLLLNRGEIESVRKGNFQGVAVYRTIEMEASPVEMRTPAVSNVFAMGGM